MNPAPPATTASKASQKARSGVFFVSLSAGAVGVVLLMLVMLLAYMLYRGSSRLFFSPVYELTFADGGTERTRLDESLEFDVPEGTKTTTRSALQAGKYFLNLHADAVTFAQAPLLDGTLVEVWQDEEVEVSDPWGDGATKVRQTVQKKKHTIAKAKEARAVADGAVALVLQDGTERRFDARTVLQFRRGDEVTSLRTMVTRYLQANPAEARRRDATVNAEEEKSRAHGFTVDPSWKGYLVAHVKQQDPDGVSYYTPQRVRALPPITSFRVAEQWNWFQFFWDFPRAGNTEGGVLPCIFGTVMMTLIMTFIVAPFGVATAIYLREYAPDNWFTRAIRLAIANLAGVPSIVFGLFGLGFFILTVGGGIDTFFFGGDKVFRTPCVLWASLTMALLTLPVMIVASEEALRAVPQDMREAALALGATKFATIATVVVPTALPGILTGVILAVARGAGEVAPLLLTGVIAHKDQLPLNPLEKFMNLAYHVYDLSVKSQPNKIEEAQALAFSAALVLVIVVLAMNLLAILLRARLSRTRVV